MRQVLFQCALGIVPVLLISIILLVLQKRHRVRNVMMTLCLALAAGSMCVMGIGIQDEKRQEEAVDIVSVAYAVADEGDVETAKTMLLKYMPEVYHSDDMTALLARISVLQSNYSAASALYQSLLETDLEDEIEDEYDYVMRIRTSFADDYVLAEHYDGEVDLSTDYKRAERDKKDLRMLVEDKIESYVDDQPEIYRNSAEILVEAGNVYDSYIENDTRDGSGAGKMLREMGSIESENSRFMDIDELSLARLKLNILNENYTEIAKNINENTNHDELLIVSELYRNGFVDEDDFNGAYGQDVEAVYEELAERMQDIYSRQPDAFNKIEKQKYKNALKYMKAAAKAPAYTALKNGMLDYTAQTNASDSTKVYLQLSKLEQDEGNIDDANRYMQMSMATAGDCEDDNFTAPMYSIISLIDDKENTEELKNVTTYVENVLDNTTAIKMKDELVMTVPNEDEDGDETEYEEDEDVEERDTGTFEQYFSDYVSKKRASLNIVSVNSDKFPEVSALVNVDSDIAYTAEELKEALKIVDCHQEIDEFEVEKIEYTKANILLCCDTSGSMSGEPIEELKTAVQMFVDSHSEIESIALVLFDGGIKEVCRFGSSDNELNAVIEKINADGGTNMYDAVLQSIDMFDVRGGQTSSIILLSDGCDNNARSEMEIMENIGNQCNAKGILLYSLGIGTEVDSDYLSLFSKGTGGSYLYVNDTQTLYEFYRYLRNQILNQYKITFKAQETYTVLREVEMSISSDEQSRDTAYYNIDGSETVLEEGLENESIINKDKKIIYGFDKKLLYKSGNNYDINLLVKDFEKEDNVSIELKGNLDYSSGSILCEYESSDIYNVKIPAGIACGTYDVHVTVNGKKAILDRGLTVVTQGSEKITSFGPYVFTSYGKAVSDQQVQLSGYVTMNGWLNFNDEVTLTGNFDDTSILLTDNDGSSVQYFEQTSKGLAWVLAKVNRSLPIPALGELTIYNDTVNSPTSDDYRVEEKELLGKIDAYNITLIDLPSFSLYPDRMELKLTQINTKLPFQGVLFPSKKNIFTFGVDERSAIITSKNIGCKLDVNIGADTKNYTPINFVKMPLYYSPGEFALSVDTVESVYSIKLIVKLLFMDGDGVGISLKWEKDEDGFFPWLNEARFYADIPVNTNISGVPVTFKDFQLGFSEFKDAKTIFDWTSAGSMDIEAASVSQLAPGLEKYLKADNLCLVKANDCELTMSLKNAYVSAKTDIQLLGLLDIAKIKLEAGNIPYTNRLLNMESEDAFGFVGKLEAGIMVNESNCKMNITGSGELSLTNRFIGITREGKCELDIHWWIVQPRFSANAIMTFGCHQTHSGDWQFLIKAQTQGNSKGAKEYFLVWSKQYGAQYGTKKL